MSTMKIATYNVNSIRSRPPLVLAWLERSRTDVLCLQETKVQDGDFPVAPFEDAGYRVACFGQKRWNGVAIVSRLPIENEIRGFGGGDTEEEARMIRATVGGVTIVNTYVPQGRDVEDPHFTYKLEWLERLLSLFASHYSPRDPILWCGDLNHAPDPIDVHDPETLRGNVCFHPKVDEVFRKALAWGFVDVFRKHCPEEGLYSFFDYRIPNAAKRGMGWRLDHILATPPLTARSVACSIDLEPRLKPKTSDHTPVVAEFQESEASSL